MEQNIPWDDISAFLNKESDDIQKQKLKEWLKSSSDNPVILDEILKAWQISRSDLNSYQPEEKLLWKKLTKRIDGHKYRRITFLHNTIKVAAVAAILILVFLSGNWYNQSNDSEEEIPEYYTTVVSPNGSRTQVVLPDSTKVWLNSGAELKYSSAFTQTNREVFTKGECYFDVIKSQEHQFIVHTSELMVKVYGTQFNVRENIERGETKVTLVTGSVQVSDVADYPLGYMVPNEQLTYSIGNVEIKEVDNTDQITAWTKDILVFDNQSVVEVAKYLEGWYGVTINLDTTFLSDQYYTFKAKTESLSEILSLISVISPIEYEINGDKVEIKSKE